VGGEKVIARDVETHLWYRATVLSLCDHGCGVNIEWDEPFEGLPDRPLAPDDIRHSTEGLYPTDDPPTEWTEQQPPLGGVPYDVTNTEPSP